MVERPTAAHGGSPPAGSLSRPSRRSGSGRNRRTQRRGGQPAASAPRRRWASATARRIRREPDGILEGGKETGAILTSEAGRGLARAGSGELGRGGARVAREPGERRIPRRDALGEEPPQPVDAFARLRRDDEQRDVAQPVVREQLPRVVSPCAGLRRGEEVRLVEHDGHGRRVRRERPQVPLVQGGVGVLLRLDDPQDEIRDSDHALRLRCRCQASIESKSGRSSSTRPSSSSGGSRCRSSTASQPSRLSAPPPQTAARVALVVGRRRLTTASSAPATRLNSRDLPTPVARECDDRMLEPEPEALAGPLDHLAGALDQRVVEPPARKLGGLAERDQPLLEVALPHAARSATVATCSRPTASADDAAGVEQRIEPRRLRSQHAVDTLQQVVARARREVRTAWSPKIASSTF